MLSDRQTDRRTDGQTLHFHIYLLLAVGVALRATPTPSWWGTSRPPKPPRARKSLRAILVTCHCSCVPVSHLRIEIDINICF